MAGEEFLIVSENSSAAAAMEAALDTLGYTYLRISSGDFTSMPVADLLKYQAVLYHGTVSSGSEDDQAVAYLQAGGNLLVADNDYAYFYCEGGSSGSVVALGPDYLQCVYESDSGSDGVLTGLDIMTGIDPDISADPYPDDITLNGPDAVAIFEAPSGNYAGLRIARESYKAILLDWDFHNIADSVDELAVTEAALAWLVGGGGGGDIPWLEETPESDTTPADSEQVVDLLFDAGVPEVDQPGVYDGVLTLVGNDLRTPEMPISVTLTVNPPADWAKVYGTVTSLGYCGENPAALEDAEIFIEASSGMSYTLTSGEDGAYAHWMAEDMYTVTVSAADHVSQQIVVDGTSAQELLRDFDLRWNEPCVNFTPEDAAVTLDMGVTDTLTLTLTNTGPMTAMFSLGEQDMGYVPAGMQPLAATDDFGYTMMHSGESAGPAFDFVDISDFGTPLGLGDDEAVAVPLPFTFNYYGNDYTEVYVSSNGLLSFGSAVTDLSNEDVMPHTNLPNNIVALMWDDLKSGTEGEIFTHIFDRCPFGNGACAVVQYDNYAHLDDTPAGTWQAILFRNGSILMQYAEAGENAGSSSTTGIENIYGTDGLMFAANVPGSLQDGLAICFAYPGRATDCVDPNVPWLDLSPINGNILGDDTIEIALHFDAGVPEVEQPGEYLAYVEITSDDPIYPTQMVPVTMTVVSPASVGTITGDVYGWNHCDVAAPAMEDALVVAESAGGSSWSATTDVSGTFTLNIDESYSPITLTVTYNGYLSEVITDVTVVGSNTTDLGDIFLRMDAPCIDTDPHAIDVTLTQGHTMTHDLMLMNMGAGMLHVSDVQGETWLASDMTTGMVEPGSQHTMTLMLDATGMSVGAHTGELVIMSDDPTTPEMHVPVTMTVIAPTIQVALTADPADRADPGDMITYTITLTNTSNGSLSLDLLDYIPANTTYIPGSATNGLSFTEAAGGDYISWSGTMDAGDVEVFTFVVQIDADFTHGDILNSVDISFADQLTSAVVSVSVQRFHIYLPLVLNATE
jgi:uncharacterized repeat protein (TIGR01451 family)